MFLFRVERLLLAFAFWWNRRTWPAVLLITFCFLPVVLVEARSNPLSNDEIYSVRIAQQPSLTQMYALAREIDLHPPVHYLAIREAMRLPGPRWFTSRLPSLVAGLSFCLALFFYTAKRFNVLLGSVAVCVAWCTPVIEYSWSDRPYALWLAVFWLLLLTLDWRAKVRSHVAAALVLVLATVLVMTHLLGCACLLILAAGEIALPPSKHDPDRLIAVFLCAPCIVAVWFHYQLHALAENAFPEQQLASFNLLKLTYYLILNNVLVVVPACVLLAALICNRRWAQQSALEGDTPRSQAKLSRRDWVYLIAFFCFPVMLFLPAQLLHVQFWTRYGAVSMPAVGVLIAWCLSPRAKLAQVSAVLIVFASIAFLVQRAVVEGGLLRDRVSATLASGKIQLSSLDPGLPIVAESPMTFTEMADREPAAITSRLFYLTDREAALRFSHYTLFENEGKIVRLLQLPARSEDLTSFLREHQRFYVVGEYDRPEVWLLRKLQADGYQLIPLGHFASSYETDQLYLIDKAR